jgi:predicted porin
MKKHLIAAAVAGALAVPAMAQVSISGRIDTSVQSYDNGTDTATRIEDNLLTTNQLVLSGSEDLGGGLKAGFAIISGFGSDVNGNLDFGSRGAAVTVSGGFGAIELGKTTGTMHNSMMASGLTGNIGNLTAIEARPNNMVGYTAPTMGGVTVRALHGVGNETPGATSGNGSQTEISVEYKAGAVLARVAQASFSDFTDGDDVAVGDLDQLGVQVDVDLGMAKINVRYTDIKYDTAAIDATEGTKQYGVGVAIPFGDGLTGALDYASGDNEDGTEGTQTSATLVKSLSKRTNVYAAYYSQSDDLDDKLFAVGVRHSF